MDLRQLEHFLAVVEMQSFTKAAQRLHVVQSGVSASIQRLERDLGGRLFDRNAGRVTLTEAGKALLPEARATLDAARSAREAVSRITTGIGGTVHLGVLPSIDAVDLPALLARLREDHAGILVRLSSSARGSAGLAEELDSGDLDAALIANDGSGVPGMGLTWLTTVPIVALLPVGHALADRTAVTLTELADAAFVDFPVGFANRRIVDTAFERLGLRRSVTVEVTTVTDAAAYVRLGLGVGLVPSIGPSVDGIRAVPVHRPALPWVLSLGVSTHRRTNAATRVLLDLLPQYVRPGPER